MQLDFKVAYDTLIEVVQERVYSIVFILGLLVVLYIIRRCKRQMKPIQTNCDAFGTLFITTRALLKVIANAVMEHSVWRIKRIKLYNKEKVLKIKLFLQIRPEVEFEQAAQRLQESIRQVLSRYFGQDKTVQIDVILMGIMPSTHNAEAHLKES